MLRQCYQDVGTVVTGDRYTNLSAVCLNFWRSKNIHLARQPACDELYEMIPQKIVLHNWSFCFEQNVFHVADSKYILWTRKQMWKMFMNKILSLFFMPLLVEWDGPRLSIRYMFGSRSCQWIFLFQFKCALTCFKRLRKQREESC